MLELSHVRSTISGMSVKSKDDMGYDIMKLMRSRGAFSTSW